MFWRHMIGGACAAAVMAGGALAEEVTARNGITYDIPSFEEEQDYRYLAGELSIDQAAAEYFATGEGMRIVDFEGSANLFHPDLSDDEGEPIVEDLTVMGEKPDLFSAMCFAPVNWLVHCAEYSAHGTAVLGLLVARNNEFGTTGLAPNAKAYIASDSYLPPLGTPPENAALKVALGKDISDKDILRKGDVLLVEAQGRFTDEMIKYYKTVFPNQFKPDQGGPFDLDEDKYDLLKAAAERGVVVVFGAGNSGVNLDVLPQYVLRPDYGAIVVGARHAIPWDWTSPVIRMALSNFGSRVTVNARGEMVTTTGAALVGEDKIFFPKDKTYKKVSDRPGPNNGTLGSHGLGVGPIEYWKALQNQPPYYTKRFGGTSSASALIAGLATALQSYHKNTKGFCLTSAGMRKLLIDSAPIFDGTGQIGASPNLLKAIEHLNGGAPKPAWSFPFPHLEWSLELTGKSTSSWEKGLTIVKTPQTNPKDVCDTRGTYVRAVTQHLSWAGVPPLALSDAKLVIEGAARLALAQEETWHYGLKEVDGVFLSYDGRAWLPLAPWATLTDNQGVKTITVDMRAVSDHLLTHFPEWPIKRQHVRIKVQSFGTPHNESAHALVTKMKLTNTSWE